MFWEGMFSDTVYRKGIRLWQNEGVDEIFKDDLSFCYEIESDYVVNEVRARIEGRNRLAISCTCYNFTRNRKYCEHMAAACYEADMDSFFDDSRIVKALSKKQQEPEKRIKEQKQNVKIVQPFVTNSEDADKYFYDMAVITQKLVFKEKTYQEALKLLERKLVAIDHCMFSYAYNNPAEKLICFEGHCEEGRHSCSIEATFSEDSVVSICCRTSDYFQYEKAYPGFKRNIEPNAYTVAFLILIDKYIKENNPGDATNQAADKFLAGFTSNSKMLVPASDSNVTESAAVILEPKLEYSYGSLELSFKIGKDKLFVLRSLNKLVQEVESEGIHALGKNAQIDFKKEHFNAEASQYYGMIKRMIREDRYLAQDYEHITYRYVELSRNHIPLRGQYIDEFYELAQHKIIPCIELVKGDKQSYGIQLRDKMPELSLVVSPNVSSSGKFRGINVRGAIHKFIEGIKYSYYLEDKYLNRVATDKIRNILSLSKQANLGEIDLLFGRNKLNDFYRRIVPNLGTNINIIEENPELIEKYLAPEAKFSFYLDYRDDRISCVAKAHYDNEEYNLMEILAGVKLPAQRDQERERQIAELLQYYFNSVDSNEGAFCIDGDEEAMWTFLDSGIKQLMELGEVNSTDAFKRLKIRTKPRIDIGVSVDSSVMDLEITSQDLTPEELLDILYSHKTKRKFYRLRNGDFLRVDDTSIDELAAMLATLRVTPKEFVKGKMHVPAYRALYLDKMLEQNTELYSKRDSNFRRLIKEFKTINESDFEPPECLARVLRNYQVQGFKWLKTLATYGFGGILADDMGLGKTLQAISILLDAKLSGEQKPSLVVCPASLVYNWQEEINRFAPELKVLLVVGTQKERAEKLTHDTEYDVLVTSYDLLKRDIAEYEGHSFNYQFIDEAQFIKTHSTAASKSVKTIKSVHRFALTGTPIENRLSELWSIFDYLMPGYLYEYEAFRRDLENPIVKNKDEAYAKRLKQLVSPFILRRLKQDVLTELPEKLEEVRMAKLEPKQQVLYDGQVVRTLKLVQSQTDENFNKSKIEVLAELTRLRQICCDPSLIFDNYNGGSAKRELCLEMVKNAIEGEHKVLIFSQFTTMLSLLEQDLRQAGIDFYTITGATPKEKRLEMVKKFNQDNVPVFLISLKAGGTGLNLTGADIVIHYDPWWNVAATNQATDRAHRIGQTKVVSVYKLIVKNSIEEKILKLQESKRDLADSVLNGEGASSIFNMSKEDIMDLL